MACSHILLPDFRFKTTGQSLGAQKSLGDFGARLCFSPVGWAILCRWNSDRILPKIRVNTSR